MAERFVTALLQQLGLLLRTQRIIDAGHGKAKAEARQL